MSRALTSPPPTSMVQTAARVLLGSAMVFAGTSHLTFARDDFQAQVPVWLPLNKDFVVLASGVVEVGLGVALLVLPRERRRVGWVLAAFYVAIFPGNISQYLSHQSAFGLDTDQKRLVRLFFQPLLVLWALWSTGAWPRRER
ncbi:DoxX family membrane protein [Deinococcus sp. KSM4-11]|uniref:DoxX family protein n=1 Tax=Deinococcus sp. KSM4-11 TaxID=2568654 RepID=UPI0010A4C4EF|nr:DoxX family membrane protein [Deinococcus sp. KSM4-11]THF85071.1 DoxX family membrane protein [Deinococcus sp. KSM4-11]